MPVVRKVIVVENKPEAKALLPAGARFIANVRGKSCDRYNASADSCNKQGDGCEKCEVFEMYEYFVEEDNETPKPLAANVIIHGLPAEALAPPATPSLFDGRCPQCLSELTEADGDHVCKDKD